MHITNDAKPSLQCTEAAKKATQALGFVKRTFSHFDCPSFSTLYKTYVRPHMEFAVQAWNPYSRLTGFDALLIERVVYPGFL